MFIRAIDQVWHYRQWMFSGLGVIKQGPLEGLSEMSSHVTKSGEDL